MNNFGDIAKLDAEYKKRLYDSCPLTKKAIANKGKEPIVLDFLHRLIVKPTGLA